MLTKKADKLVVTAIRDGLVCKNCTSISLTPQSAEQLAALRLAGRDRACPATHGSYRHDVHGRRRRGMRKIEQQKERQRKHRAHVGIREGS